MAEWRKRRLTIRRVLDMLKDQFGRGLAFATSSFPGMHLAIVMATSHDECAPEERHVQTILAAGTGSRLRVSYCTKTLVKRLTKTQNWVVALKSLIVLHRALREGGFLFQDRLCFFADGARDYLNLSSFKDDSGPLAWALSSWVRKYARFLDERLVCSKVLGSFMDRKVDDSGERLPYLATGELLEDIFALQALLQEVFACEADGIAAENGVVVGALRLVFQDSYSIQGELRYRFQEMMERLDVLQLSEALQLLQICRKASEQTPRLLEFYDACEALGGIPEASQTPQKLEFSDLDMQKVTDAIKAASKQPSLPSVLRGRNHKSRLSFSIAPQKNPSVLRRSRSSSSPAQLNGHDAYASSRVSARGEEGRAVQRGVAHAPLGTAGGEAMSLRAVVQDHLTGDHLLPDQSSDRGQPHVTNTFPDHSRSFRTGPVYAIESAQPQDWERALMESISGSDTMANPSRSSNQEFDLLDLGVNLSGQSTDVQRLQRPAQASGAGGWEHPGSATSVPPYQRTLGQPQPQPQMPQPVWRNFNGISD